VIQRSISLEKFQIDSGRKKGRKEWRNCNVFERQ